MRRILLASLVLAAFPAGAAADVFVLTDGDRITGKVLAETKRSFRIQTAYGRLVIPRSRVERIRRDDGTEDVISPPTEAPPPPPPPPRTARVVLVVTGKAFWQAWDPKEAPADPALRFEVRLDEEVVAAIVDRTMDPGDIPGALVNAFSFAPADTTHDVAAGSRVAEAEVRPARIVVKLDVPPSVAPTALLRLAYQVNEGTAEEAAWRDVVEAAAAVPVSADAPTVVALRQERGRMEFTKRGMKGVETYRLFLTRETPVLDTPSLEP